MKFRKLKTKIITRIYIVKCKQHHEAQPSTNILSKHSKVLFQDLKVLLKTIPKNFYKNKNKNKMKFRKLKLK